MKREKDELRKGSETEEKGVKFSKIPSMQSLI